MALENLEGDNVFIDDLNAAWPMGSDYPSDGDDHIRGIKKVLKNTFPYFNKQVTRSADDLNASAIPAGTVMVFYQSAVPAGWERVQSLSNADGWMLRVVQTTDTAGSAAGTDSPILNNKVPSHAHSVPAFNTGGENVGHQHYSDFMTGAADRSLAHNTGGFSTNHQHLYTRPGGVIGGINLAGGGGHTVCNGGLVEAWTSAANLNHTHYTSGVDHLHAVKGWTGDRSQGHVHYVSAHATSANASASNWAPKYMNVMLCARKYIPLTTP